MITLYGFLRKIEAGIHALSRWSSWISVGVLIILVITVGIDVVGRKFGHPLLGSIDLGEVMLVVIVFFALAFAQLGKGHVRVSALVTRLSIRGQGILDTITLLLSSGVYALIVYAMTNRARDIIVSAGSDPVTSLLEIPMLPFIIVVTVGSLLLCLELLVDFSHALANAVGMNTTGSGQRSDK